MENSEIRLLLLDFDGTLADTRRANTLSYVAALGEAGYTLTEEEYAARYFGMRCNEFLTRFGIADPAERERLRLRKIALYPTFFDTVRLNEPLWTFCRQFHAGGGRVWVVSTGSRANIDNVMRHLGIGGPTAEGGVSGTGFHSGGTDPAAPLGRVDGILSGADETRSGLFSGGHAPRRLHAARDADLRGFRNRHRGGTPQRSVLFRGEIVDLNLGDNPIPTRCRGR